MLPVFGGQSGPSHSGVVSEQVLGNDPGQDPVVQAVVPWLHIVASLPYITALWY